MLNYAKHLLMLPRLFFRKIDSQLSGVTLIEYLLISYDIIITYI